MIQTTGHDGDDADIKTNLDRIVAIFKALSNTKAKLAFDKMMSKLRVASEMKIPEELLLVVDFGSTLAPVIKATTNIDLFLVFGDPLQGKL
jgi:hypothetical protein